MTFKDTLNEILTKLGCTGRMLADAGGISPSVISRYRSGRAVPMPDSGQWHKLAAGIKTLAEWQGLDGGQRAQIEERLLASLPGKKDAQIDRGRFSEHLDLLMDMFSIGNNDLARHMNYDASYVSRIRSGQRFPRDASSFAEEVGLSIARRCRSESDWSRLEEVTGEKLEQEEGSEAFVQAIVRYLCYDRTSSGSGSINTFLRKLDSFDLEEYIRVLRFKEIELPAVRADALPAGFFRGLLQMMEAQLAFLQYTIGGSSSAPVTMYSDLPISEMSGDADFSKKWMLGMAEMLRKGLRLRMIHNVDRPFHEMMLGLESFIPLYMTGQIDPYYLSGMQNSAFRHMLWVSGTAALEGGCITGHVEDGKLYLTTDETDLAHYGKMAEQLLKRAAPLMEIYTQERQADYARFSEKDSAVRGNRRLFRSSLPVYTLSDELAQRILRRNEVPDALQAAVMDHIHKERVRIGQILQHSRIEEELPMLPEKEYRNHPMVMALSNMFCPVDISVSYTEYQEHLALCSRFGETNPGYTCVLNKNPAFRNIRISVLEKGRVVVSRMNAPAIHFVIRHPGMCRAVESMVIPVVDAV